MPAVYPAPITRVQGEQLSLSTSLASLGIPPNAVQALIYVPSTAFRLHLNPALVGVRFYDASAGVGSRFLNATLLTALTDGSTGTGTGTIMDSATTSDRLYVCFAAPTAGMRAVIGNANAAASGTLTGHYWNGSAFSALSITDGTNDGTRTMAQTGSVTWTAVTDWATSALSTALGLSSADEPEARNAGAGFWARFQWDLAFDSDTSITGLWALNNDTNRGYFRSATEYAFSFDRRMVGSVEMVLASGTDTADITWTRTTA